MRLASGLVVVILAAACNSPGASETVSTTTRVPVTVASVGLGAVEATVLATGTVVAAPGAELLVSAPVAARVRRLPYGEGQRVPRGAVLAEFDIPSLAADAAARRSDVAQARTRATLATSAFERVSGLFDRGIAAQKEVEAARRELEDSEAAVGQVLAAQHAAAELAGRGTVRAPFAGLVVRRWHSPGDLVDGVSTDPVLRLVDPTRLQIEVQVPGPDASRVRVGQLARVRVASSSSSAPIDGTIHTDPVLVDPASAAFAVRVALLHGESLPLGLPVEVTIVVERRENRMTVPVAALVREQESTFVYVVSPDGHAQRQTVTVGLVSSTVVEILTGLQPSARVITQGHTALPDGAAVTVTR